MKSLEVWEKLVYLMKILNTIQFSIFGLKASSDHLVRSWHRTYGLPTSISNCSNNYGPYQNPEKLIPRIILNAINGNDLPIYGNGLQKRDWLFVEDHADALYEILIHGKGGETYNVGGNNEKTNLEIVKKICNILDRLIATKPNGIESFRELINFVPTDPDMIIDMELML